MINRVRVAAAVTASGALLVPLALFAGPGFAHGSPSAAQYQYTGKVTICHHAGKSGKSHTITVGAPAWKAHQKHGDTLGPCPAPTATPRAGESPKVKDDDDDAGDHGKKDDKSKGHDNGKGHDKGKGHHK